MSAVRHCDHCGKELKRRPGEVSRNWNRRKFCNRVCSVRWMKDRDPVSDTNRVPFAREELAAMKLDAKARELMYDKTPEQVRA